MLNTGINKIMLLGNLCEDARYHHDSKDTGFVQVSLVTHETFGKNGDTIYHYEKHCIKIPSSIIDANHNLFVNGKMMYVEGKIQTRSFTDSTTGVKRYKSEIWVSQYRFIS